MIHTSLPLKPRINSPAETITTPLSVLHSEDKRILSITAINTDSSTAQQYSSTIEQVLGNFDEQFYDNDPIFLSSIKDFLRSLSIRKVHGEVTTCSCKKFEELVGIRMYNQRRVIGATCTYCSSPVFNVYMNFLLLDLNWERSITSWNQKWVHTDFVQFEKRTQHLQYKLSKEVESVKFPFDGELFGVRHQIIWAYVLVYLCNKFQDFDITLHFVHRVSDVAFLCSCLAKQFDSRINIHLHGLPAVWLPETKNLQQLTSLDLQKILKGITSSRKELKL